MPVEIKMICQKINKLLHRELNPGPFRPNTDPLNHAHRIVDDASLGGAHRTQLELYACIQVRSAALVTHQGGRTLVGVQGGAKLEVGRKELKTLGHLNLWLNFFSKIPLDWPLLLEKSQNFQKFYENSETIYGEFLFGKFRPYFGRPS